MILGQRRNGRRRQLENAPNALASSHSGSDLPQRLPDPLMRGCIVAVIEPKLDSTIGTDRQVVLKAITIDTAV